MRVITNATSRAKMDKCFELAGHGKLNELKSLLGENSHVLNAADSRGKTLLHVAAESGRREVVQYLIELLSHERSRGNNAKDNDGDTPLHLAVRNNHVGVADLLLSSGASAVVQNSQKIIPLHIALQNQSSTDMLAAFAKHHDITDQVSRGFRNYTSLHVVAASNNLQSLKFLYDAAVAKPSENAARNFLQLDSVDRDGLTPIHLAARKGSYDVLDFLISKAIEHGIQPRNVLESLSEKDSTPLHYAIESNSLEIVRILLKYGASPTATCGKQGPPIHLACSQNKLNMVRAMVEHSGHEILNCKNEKGQVPLHSSTPLIGGKELISFLLSQGSQLNMRDACGRTPLQVAVRFGNVSSMEQLLASGSSPLVKDDHGCNCLHMAVMFKRKEVFKHLLDHPSITEMCDTPNNEQDLPIHLALRQGMSSYIAPLLECMFCDRQSDKDTLRLAMDKDGHNYFHLAASAGDEKTLEILLTYPFADSMINATDSSGKTPLHSSAIGGNLACISLLLDHGAMVNKCNCGRTPFMYACAKGKLQSAKALYEAHPFQKNWKDDDGDTALHLAASSGSSDVTNYCLDLGIIITLNEKRQSFFDIIIQSLDSKLAISVLKHDRWEECLDIACPTKPHPVIRLICQIPNAFPVVLDRSITRSPLDPQHKHYWEKYNFKYISLQDGTKVDNTATNAEFVNKDQNGAGSRVSDESEHQKESIPSSRHRKEIVRQKEDISGAQVQLEMETLQKNEESNRETSAGDSNLLLEAANVATISDSASSGREEENSSTAATGASITIHQRGHHSAAAGEVPTMKVLKILTKKRNKRCLTHPVITRYLSLKWVDYARTLYIVKFLTILLMTIFLSTFIGITPLPSQLINGSTAATVTENEISTAANVIRFVTIFLAALNGIIWICTIYVMRIQLLTHFIEEIEFWAYGCAILSTFIYLIPFHGLNSVIYEAGAIAVFASWCVALLQIELFGVMGIYVSMLISTMKNVLKVLAICFFFLCAFGFSFHILVGSFSQLQFTNVGTSLVSSLSSALAIIDLNTFVALEFAGSLRFRALTFIFYVLLVITLPIVVINLLIGLAVGDIAKIQEDSEISRTVLVVNILSKIDERLLSRRLLIKVCRRDYVFYPNRVGGGSRFVSSKLKRALLKSYEMFTLNDKQIGENESGQEAKDEEDRLEAIEKLQRQVDQLTKTQAKQNETLARMELMLLKLMEHQQLKCD